MIAVIIFVYVCLALVTAFTNIAKSGAVAFFAALLFLPFMIAFAIVKGGKKKEEAIQILKGISLALILSSFFVVLFKYII